MNTILQYLWNVSPSIAEDLFTRSSGQYFQVQPPNRRTKQSTLRNTWTILNGLYLLLFGVCRFLAGFYMLVKGRYFSTWLYYDTSAFVVYHILKVDNPIASVAFIPFPLFVFAIDYHLHFKRYNYIMRLMHEYIIRNKEQFFDLNPQLRLHLNWRQPLTTVKHALHLMRVFRNPPKAMLATIHFSFDHFTYAPPYLAKETRIQAVYYSLLLQAMVAYVHFLLVAGASIVAPFYYIALIYPNARTWLGHLISLTDITFCVYNFVGICTNLMHGAHSYLTLQLVAHKHMPLMNRMLGRANKAVLRGAMSMSRFAAHLRFFMDEHMRMLLGVIHGNREITSPVLLLTFISNITVNMYMVSSVNQLKMSTEVVVTFLLIVTIQIFATTGFVAPMLQHIRDLYSCLGPLYKTQRAMQTQTNLDLLQIKLKLTKYFEIVCTNEPIRFTVGPISKITTGALIEFLIFYTGNVLNLLRYIRKMN